MVTVSHPSDPQRRISAEKAVEPVEPDYVQDGTSPLNQVRASYRSPAHRDRKLSDLFTREPSAAHAVFPWSRLVPWFLLAAVFTALFVAVYRFAVTTNAGQIWEYATLESARLNLATLHTITTTVLSETPTVVGVLAVLTFLVLTLYRRRWLASVIALLSFAGANITTQLLKTNILVRPYLDNGVPYYTGNSLPSGHTTFAAASVFAIMLVIAPRWRGLVAGVGTVFSVGVGIATYLESWHRPADMAAAFLIAGIWALVGGFAVYRTGPEWNGVGRKLRSRGASGWEVLSWFLAVISIFAAVALFFVAGGITALPETVTEEYQPSLWHLLFSCCAIAGAGFLVAAIVAGFFRVESTKVRFRQQPAQTL